MTDITENPIEEFLKLSAGVKPKLPVYTPTVPLSETQKRELEMWHTWKQGGQKPEDLKPLLNSLRPLIKKESNKWAVQRDVPPAAVHAEFINQAVKALETYDPTRAGLGTHIRTQLKRAPRFVTTYQNAAYIPETRIYSIQPFKNAVLNLEESLGRPPTQLEIADHLKWSPRKVALMQKEVRGDIPSSSSAFDPTAHTLSKSQEILRLLPYELTTEERAVFEYLYGVNGKPKLVPGEIASRLKISSPKVSRIKAAIAEKYARYM